MTGALENYFAVGDIVTTDRWWVSRLLGSLIGPTGGTTNRSRLSVGLVAGHLVLDLDMGLADRVAHRLNPLTRLLAHDDFLGLFSDLVDDRLFFSFLNLDRLVAEDIASWGRPGDRSMLDRDGLIPQANILLDRQRAPRELG
jgi:hypothetical protein